MDKKFFCVVVAFTLFLGIIIGYYIGKPKEVEKTEEDSNTFYGIIENINGNSILVNGLEENDINYRTKYSFIAKEETVLEWRGTKINVTDLKVGDRVSITFNGPVLDSYPGQLTNVIKVQLLSDRMDNSGVKFTIVDETKNCAEALELFYEDEAYNYYFNCVKSSTIYVVFEDGTEVTVKEAVNSGLVTIQEVEDKLNVTNAPNEIIKQPKGE